jgi:hypothetical protein
MNSIQLISKINARIEDLAMLSQEVLKPNNELTNIEKEVLKRTCSDLFELVLKLKTSNDQTEEHQALKENISKEIKNEEINFKEILANKVKEDFTINTLAEKEQDKKEFSWNPPSLLDITATNNETAITENTHKEPITENQLIEPKQTEIHNELNLHEKEPIIQEEIMASISNMDEPNLVSGVLNIEDDLTTETVITEQPNTQKFTPETNNFTQEFTPNIPNKTEEVNKIEPPVPVIPPAPVIENKIEPEPVEEKSKPSPFFSIGKTVLPRSEGSLNEKLAQKIDSFQLSDKIIEPKIDNLKTAISLNKKIAFVNELFKENVVEYAKSIDKINNANDLNEAMLIWTEMKISHNWKSDNTLMLDLEKLIQRRFS